MSGTAQLTLRQGDVLQKTWEIDTLLGSGPTGKTWLAHSIADGRKVAVKLLAGPALDAATAAGILQRLKETKADALVGYVDSGEHLGARFLIQEYVEAESLRRLMDAYAGQKKPFTLQEACQIAVRLLEAAEAAHKHGFIHRYIKPSAVLVATRHVGPGAGKAVRTIRLTGLGESDLVSPAVLAENLVESTDTRYLAPEFGTGGAITTRCDVYSIGVILYELLTGQTPLGSYLAPSQVREDLPRRIDDIVDIALAANAEDRYPTARDMINDIQRTFTDDDKGETEVPRRQWGAVIGGVSILVAGVAALLFFNNPDAAAHRKDAELRATVVKANTLPSQAETQKRLEGHPGMQWIPAGTYIQGRMNGESGNVAQPTEPLAHEEKIGAFYIDIFEAPNRKGGNASVGVTYAEAEAACAADGKRLCTAAEWERACKGPEDTIYSYGDTYSPEACGGDIPTDANKDNAIDRASGSLDACKSGWGVYDLSGGAAEWTSSNGSSDPAFKVVKGGKQGNPDSATRCAWQTEQASTYSTRGTGFRCCLDSAP